MIKTISTTIIVTVIGFTITACCFITKDTDYLWGINYHTYDNII